MSEQVIPNDLTELALSLGYHWPDDDEGRWRVLCLMAERAAHWRSECSRLSKECKNGVEREKLYQHQQQRYLATLRKLTNTRKALRQFMTYQVAYVREAEQNIVKGKN